jgi:hypothetical protein
VIVSTPPLGTTETWRVVRFKHKVLALLHDIMETLPFRFPAAQGIYRFQTKGNNLAPILEQVKNVSERDAEISNLYLRDRYPLGFASRLLGKSTIEFAGRVIGQEEVIRTCVGTDPERRSAVASVYAAIHRGIVLDTYTAWVAYSLDLIEVLKTLFGRVALPQSSIDELREWRQRFEPAGDDPLPSPDARRRPDSARSCSRTLWFHCRRAFSHRCLTSAPTKSRIMRSCTESGGRYAGPSAP